jgi:hypothetical protein
VSTGGELPAGPDTQRAGLETQSRTSLVALADLVERITPWLVEIGGWVFGGLGAFGVVLIAALITVGPVDPSILVALAALVIALPMNLTGLLLLRLIKDTKAFAIEDITLQAFRGVGFPDIEAYFPAPQERASAERRRLRITLAYCWSIVILSALLTLAGTAAALWHMAWWAPAVLIAALVASALLGAVAIRNSLPPASEAERALVGRQTMHGQ